MNIGILNLCTENTEEIQKSFVAKVTTYLWKN